MALPGSVYRQEYEVNGEKRALIFTVPNFTKTSRERAVLQRARDMWFGTESKRRIDAVETAKAGYALAVAEAADSGAEPPQPWDSARDTVDVSDCPASDWIAWNEWSVAGFDDTIAQVIGYEIGGIADARSIDDIRASLPNDLTAHGAIRIARFVLFMNAGDGPTRDAE